MNAMILTTTQSGILHKSLSNIKDECIQVTLLDVKKRINNCTDKLNEEN